MNKLRVAINGDVFKSSLEDDCIYIRGTLTSGRDKLLGVSGTGNNIR